MSNIKDILCTEKNVILQVSSEDLKAFAQEILIEAKTIAMIQAEAAASSDKLLTIDEAAKLLSVSRRWRLAANAATARVTSNASPAVKFKGGLHYGK